MNDQLMKDKISISMENDHLVIKLSRDFLLFLAESSDPKTVVKKTLKDSLPNNSLPDEVKDWLQDPDMPIRGIPGVEG